MIPDEYKINDTRTTSDFNKQSFSGYAIKDVVSVLNKSLMSCKIEDSVNWAVELLLSGQTERLWEKIFSISLKNININNPKLPIFLFKRYNLQNHLCILFKRTSSCSCSKHSRRQLLF